MNGPVLRVGLAGADPHEYRPSDAPIMIGRAVGHGIQVPDPLVSRNHAVLTYDNGWFLSDAGSTNGVWLHGSRIDRTRLVGAVGVRLGDMERGAYLDLVVEDVTGPGRGTPPAPHRELVIGRDPSAGLCLQDPMVSWRHARVTHRSDGWWVHDLGSTNSTIVNGSAVLEGRLHDGDHLLIGNVELAFAGGSLRATDQANFVVHRAGLALKDGRRIVDGVSFSIAKPSLVAVIGPSGAGKSSLLRLLTGQVAPSSGTVSLNGTTMLSQRRAHRGHIGVVPQHTVAHASLTARQALDYTARLRLAHDVGAVERHRRVDAVLERLGMREHADTKMARLSGGQQRRVGIAMEMLTDPSMLILDEPTAGLDPSLVKQIMHTLRGLADAGKHVLVVTHDLEHLAMVDEVLVLRAGGTVAFFGRPAEVFEFFGTSSWADTFAELATPAASSHAEASPDWAAAPPTVADLTVPRATSASVLAHARVVLARQVRLTVTDRLYLVLLVGMPLVLGMLALAVPGGDGLGAASDPTNVEAARLLVLLVVGAAFLGLSAPIRDLVSERPIFVHEREAGLSPGGYLTAKVLLFSALSATQAVLLVTLLLLFRPGPRSALVLTPAVELTVAVVATALTGVTLGLAVSSRVATTEQSMPPLVLLVMGQLVMSGGLFPIDGRGLFPAFSLAFPTRWGYAAAASTVDLNNVSPSIDPDDLWVHTTSNWLACLIFLAVLATLFLAVAARGVARRHRFT